MRPPLVRLNANHDGRGSPPLCDHHGFVAFLHAVENTGSILSQVTHRNDDWGFTHGRTPKGTSKTTVCEDPKPP